MPELPEVETTRRGIAPHLEGQRVSRVIVRDRRLRWPIPEDLDVRLSGQRIVLVGIDFSATARHALAWALEYAQHTPCELHTLHVIDRRWRRSDLDADASALRGELADVHAAAIAELSRLVEDDTRARLGGSGGPRDVTRGGVDRHPRGLVGQ